MNPRVAACPVKIESPKTPARDRLSVSLSHPGFSPIPLRLLLDERKSISPITVSVYAALASYANYGTGSCRPSHAKIAERARMNERTARRHIKLLIDLAYIQKRSGKAAGTANTYHLVDPWGRAGAASMRQGGRTPGSEGSDTRVRPGRTPGSDKREPMNESQGREAAAQPSTKSGGVQPRKLPTPLLVALQQEARTAHYPFDFEDRIFRAGLRRALEVCTPSDITAGWRWALNNEQERAFLRYLGDRVGRWIDEARKAAVKKPGLKLLTSCKVCGTEYQAKRRGGCPYCQEHRGVRPGESEPA